MHNKADRQLVRGLFPANIGKWLNAKQYNNKLCHLTYLMQCLLYVTAPMVLLQQPNVKLVSKTPAVPTMQRGFEVP
jgi:hypothetical protein